MTPPTSKTPDPTRGQPWVKVPSSLAHDPRIRKAGFAGGVVFRLLLEIHGRAGHEGFIGSEWADPEYLADELGRGCELDLAAAGLEACRRVGLIEIAPDGVRIAGWDVQWRGPLTEAERKRDQRSKGKPEAPAEGGEGGTEATAAPPEAPPRPDSVRTPSGPEERESKGESSPSEKSGGSRPPASPESPEARQLAEAVRAGILAAKPDHKWRADTKWRPVGKRLAQAIHLMLTVDGRRSEVVRAAADGWPKIRPSSRVFYEGRLAEHFREKFDEIETKTTSPGDRPEPQPLNMRKLGAVA